MYLNKGILFLAGIILSFAYDDLSWKQNATHYMAYPGRYDLYKAVNAVDRNMSTCTRTDAIGGSSPYNYTWWKMDLGGVYNIYSVNIVFKNYDNTGSQQRGRFAGFSLYVSTTGVMDNSSLCYKDGSELPPLNFTTTCITSGRYVIYYNERRKGVTYPAGYQLDNIYTELCEVTVLGCQGPGVYGNNCDVACPTNCRDNVCHIQEGTCFGCTPGWTGTKCDTKCPGGWYDVDCKKQCFGHCKDNFPCNHVTGQCDGGCAAGWRGNLCDTGCADGTYGNNCAHNCSSFCLNEYPCNKTTGNCQGGCKPGYTEPLCNKHCLLGYFGYKCQNLCPAHCLSNKNCHPIDGTCIDGCEDGYTGSHCNASCTVGYYGHNCSRVCSSECKSCKHTDGTCSCPAGLIGLNCSVECPGGRYGVDCKHQCSGHCRDHAVCNHVTGQCDRGCAAGWTEPQCDIECADGTYGKNCSHQCSENCLNDSSCNKQTGHCDRGCKPGYTQPLCKEPHCLNNTHSNSVDGTCINGCKYGFIGKQCNCTCKEGYYGSNCSQVCYGNCKTCKHTDGACRSCFAGWMGPNCTIGCLWSYGEDCQYPCNKHCVNQTCDRVNGSCLSGCDGGFYGPKCDQEHASTSCLDSHLSALFSGLLGAFVSAFVFLTSAVVIYVSRRKRLSRPETKSSPYAEVENHQSGDSTYQELTVTELDKAYQNLALQ